MKQNITLAIAVVALIAVSGLWLFSPHGSLVSNGSQSFGATTAGGLLAENYIPYVLYNGGYNSAKDINTSAFLGTTGTFQVGSTNSTIAGIQFGTCTGITYATLATSTPINCAVTGALSTDTNVLMWLNTQQAGNDNTPFGITGGTGSTTNGFIVGRIFQIGNLNGTTPGFTATTSYPLATTSIRYLIIR